MYTTELEHTEHVVENDGHGRSDIKTGEHIRNDVAKNGGSWHNIRVISSACTWNDIWNKWSEVTYHEHKISSDLVNAK